MRLKYRVLVAAAALVVAAATFYPLPIEATAEQEKGAAKQDAKENVANVKITADEEITAKVELVNFTNPAFPEEAKKLGINSKVYLRLRIVGAEGGGTVVEAGVDSVTVSLPEDASVDRDTMKRIQAQFEKNAIEATKTWTFNVESTGLKADTVEVIIPVVYKLH